MGVLSWLRRLFDRSHTHETAKTIHALRERAQMTELERWRIQQGREQGEPIADALARSRPPWSDFARRQDGDAR